MSARSEATASAAEALGTAPLDADAELCAILEPMGVRLRSDLGRVEVEGWVNMDAGLVELFACGPRGKTHESVVVLDCVPSGLHAALLALGLRPGPAPGVPAEEPGDSVEVTVRWAGADGEARSARAEEWIWNALEERSMPACGWRFLGSFSAPVTDVEESAYAADHTESLVVTHRDESAVLENPLEGVVDDTLYHVNEGAVPTVGTPVLVTFARSGVHGAPPREDDR